MPARTCCHRVLAYSGLVASRTKSATAGHELHKAASQVSNKRAEILGKKGASNAKPSMIGIIGFQPITLATDARCAKCDTKIGSGEDAHLGIGADASAAKVIVCEDCRPRPRAERDKKKEK